MRLFFSVLFLVLGIAVTAQTAMKFTIKGELVNINLPVKMVYLYYTVDGIEHGDSALVKNGKYSFTGKLTEPRMGYFSIWYSDASIIPSQRRDLFTAFLDKGTITITSTDSFSNRKVQGSAVDKVYSKLFEQDKPYNDQINEMYRQAAQFEKEGKKKEALALEDKADKLDDERRDKVYGAFVKANPSSPLVIYALNIYAGRIRDPQKIEPVWNTIPTSLRSTYSGKDFLGRLEGAKRLRIGMKATDFTQNDTSGSPISLSSLKGKYVLVDFWASWCAPCRSENPNVVAMYNKYKDKNFTVLGVALEREGQNQTWMNAIHKDGLTWTHVSDFKYFNNAAAKLYGINAIPRNFLIDPSGVIVATDLRSEALQKKLEEIIK